jgi:hypothetical protein
MLRPPKQKYFGGLSAMGEPTGPARRPPKIFFATRDDGALLGTTSFMNHEIGFPWLALLCALVGTTAYVGCFVIAARTGKLKPLDYVAGTLGLGCGFGWLYFMSRANTVTLQHSFDMVNKGGDPAASRALNQQFKYTAGAAIACWILSVVLFR